VQQPEQDRGLAHGDAYFMKVLTTGASGQLGGALPRTALSHAELNAIDINDVDFIGSGMLRARLVLEAPNVIVNAAAYKRA
jgi:dTDP-4-dehydrorhamnose reductase